MKKMKRYTNLTQALTKREIDVNYAEHIKTNYKVTEDFAKRLGLIGELDAHTGCVNCLEWSSDGRLLASGSDDVHICIWDPFRKKKITCLPTGHNGNVFTVKFIPNTGDHHIVSGAADHAIRIHDTPLQECFRVCTCHSSRVKRIVTDISTPHLFWSAAEDGLILQHDLRSSHICSSDAKKPRNVLIDLKSYIGNKGEAKCLSLSPVQPELMAVGANDPYIRLYDRRMIKVQFLEGDDGSISSDCPEIPAGAVKYFVPGHLPSKISDYMRKYRQLASTYVEFSPDGNEILTNLGGEQIYLFPLRGDLQEDYTSFSFPEAMDLTLPKQHEGTNGYTNGFRKELSQKSLKIGKPKKKTGLMTLPKHVEKIKIEANEAFEGRKYSRAIQLYNEALFNCPLSPILLGNRAAALLKRAWDGDIYMALRDCCSALNLDSSHHKAYLRLCRCLFELARLDEALTMFDEFKRLFPNFMNSMASSQLEKDLEKAKKKREEASPGSDGSDHSFFSSTTNTISSSNSSSQSANELSPLSSRITHHFFFQLPTGSNESSTSVQSNDSDILMGAGSPSAEDPNLSGRSGTSGNPGEDAARDHSEPTTPYESIRRVPKYQLAETDFRSKAADFLERYCGHCNTTTDIKEANFFGNYIVAGSDDGSFFIWDRKTTNIVKILRGDESIVNCLQPHPSTCLLATSGIEQVVRLWAPLPEDGTANDRLITDWNGVASENQKRMNSNPFEVILMNMGYRLNPDDDASDEDAYPGSRQSNPCNQS